MCTIGRGAIRPQFLEVKNGIDQMLEQPDLTDGERQTLEGDRDAVTALAERLANIPTPGRSHA
ncbi:hypothetical protein ACIBP6_22510 [Nonomuraea terrae]|uniref:hypothetical protein n=1 Tax=Nonomuraea terrae TaxID=2530383 RepID=UPI0037BBB7E7